MLLVKDTDQNHLIRDCHMGSSPQHASIREIKNAQIGNHLLFRWVYAILIGEPNCQWHACCLMRMNEPLNMVEFPSEEIGRGQFPNHASPSPTPCPYHSAATNWPGKPGDRWIQNESS